MATKLPQTETNTAPISQRLFAVVAFICLLPLSAFAGAKQCRKLFDNETKKEAITTPVRPASQQVWNGESLRIITFNTDNLTLHQKSNTYIKGTKPKDEKLAQAAAKTLFDANPDIIVLQEVGDEYSLKKLVQLGGRADDYETIFIQGNEFREGGISRHIGFVIKKSLNLKHTIATNLEIPYTGSDLKRDFLFDRGLPVVSFFDPNTQQPLFSVIGVHNHSLGKDRKFAELKDLEEKSMLAVIQKLQDAYTTAYPIILAGDLNTDVNRSLQLTKLKSKMVESFDALKVAWNSAKRTTQIWNRLGSVADVARQVDGVFVSEILSRRVKTAKTLQLPIANVSDHSPLMVEINLKGIFTRLRQRLNL